MPAPGFWYPASQGHLLSRLTAQALRPAAAVYAAAGRRRLAAARPVRVSVPVICVGNLTLGGTGKTPLALYLAELARARGLTPFFLTRGYGGRLAGPARVEPDGHGAGDVGDEPLLLAAQAPTIVARDRPQGAALAAAQGADLIIMDDGFQNPSLAKDLSLVVVDGAARFGNGLVFPAGPLREPVADGLKRADLVVVLGAADDAPPLDLPVAVACLDAALTPVRTLESAPPYFAFAGIGRPEKFFTSVRQAGGHVVGTWSFADHHPYSKADVARLHEAARARGATLITTSKDRVRLPAQARNGVAVLEVRLEIRQQDRLNSLLCRVFDACPGKASAPANP